MSVAFFRRFFDAAEPSFQQQRPEDHRAGNDQEAKTPTAVSRVRVNLANAHKYKRNGHGKATSQVNSKRDEKCRRDHDGAGLD